MPFPSTASGPNGWGTTLGTTSVNILPLNPTRSSLVFVNQGSTSIAVCPATVNQGVNGVYAGFAAGVASVGGAGSITILPGDKFIFDQTICTCAWNGISSAPGGVLTIFEG